MPRFAANLSTMFAEVPFLERFERAARAGFGAVEFQLPYEYAAADVRARLDAAGLVAVLFNTPPGDAARGERGLACLPGREADFRASIDKAIDYARCLGVPRLHCLAGMVPAGVDAALLRRTLVANLRRACAGFEKEAMTVLIEPLNAFDMPGYYLGRTDQALDLLDEVGAPNLRLQYDLYHAARSGDELAATLERHLARIGHIQLADHPGRHEPGTGTIDFAPLFALLDRLGYAGHVGCEYAPLVATEASLGWLAAASRASAAASAEQR